MCRVPAAFQRAGIRFLDHPVPAAEFRLPYDRPTGDTQPPDRNGVPTLHTHETRSGWAPS